MNRKSQLHTSAAPTRAAIKKLIGAGLISAAATAPAHAGFIDFEGYFGPVGGTESIQQAGYDIGFYANVEDSGLGSLVGSFMDGTDASACVDMACPVNNPGTYYAALNDSYIDIMSSTPGSQFKISSFDASFIGSSLALGSYPAVSGLLRIQGFRANGSSVTETYELDSPGATGFNFAHFNTSAGFGNTSFVEAALFGFVCNSAGSCSAFSTNQGQFGIDNIEVVSVPEPSSFLLFGLGMLAMGAAARRRAGR